MQQQRPAQDDKMQDCVDGATAGDSIELTTNVPVDDGVTISKSLTFSARSTVATATAA